MAYKEGSIQPCRLCFQQVNDYIDIFGDSALIPNVFEPLNQYFYDEVTESDILPKIICRQCWSKIEKFRAFAEEVIASREQYLRQHFPNRVNNDDTGDSEMPNVEVQIHEESVYVAPVSAVQNDNGEVNKPQIDSTKIVANDVDVDEFNWYKLFDSNETQRNCATDDLDLLDCIDNSCDLCSKTMFKTYKEIVTHYRNEHQVENGYVKCCQEKFYAVNFLRDHFLAWHINHSLFRFQNEQMLGWHHDHHKSTYLCERCAEEFKTKSQYESHMAKHGINVSKSLIKFRCDQCGKISPNANALQTHIRQVHCESKYKCHMCSKSFKHEDSLKDHIAMHLKSKNYKCPYCEQSFVWRSNMYKHRKQLHRHEWMLEKRRES